MNVHHREFRAPARATTQIGTGRAIRGIGSHEKAVTVTTCGRICYNRKKINLSQVFAGHPENAGDSDRIRRSDGRKRLGADTSIGAMLFGQSTNFAPDSVKLLQNEG
ncbi:hypothetical protein [Mesorhizobium sp.]|uniref:hypothetical protein n=1 Tax=Mesorhizobium sp. TaxID=1871066 RepID=UPI000FE8343B|nr:hypothetical protein [Mesorhizobium sp.]RWJ28112.1 MAG: hypothetical protein EOR28_24340 [Mesorhizobium sp.]TIQ72382.1 MAG: hypothetical protein E5X40_14295 [Mesorhizobium sp.]